MALIKDFEIPGSGYTVPGAYHVVTRVEVTKSLGDLTMLGPDGQETTRPAYTGQMSLSVWANKEARTSGSSPVGSIYGGPGDEDVTRFNVDMASTKTFVEQAYDHLKTTEAYKDATAD